MLPIIFPAFCDTVLPRWAVQSVLGFLPIVREKSCSPESPVLLFETRAKYMKGGFLLYRPDMLLVVVWHLNPF